MDSITYYESHPKIHRKAFASFVLVPPKRNSTGIYKGFNTSAVIAGLFTVVDISWLFINSGG